LALPRHPSAAAWRANHPIVLQMIHKRLEIDAMTNLFCHFLKLASPRGKRQGPPALAMQSVQVASLLTKPEQRRNQGYETPADRLRPDRSEWSTSSLRPITA